MARFWDGSGELEDDEVFFTLNNGLYKGRPYVRKRAEETLRELSWCMSLAFRKEILRGTIDSDEWLRGKAGMLVSAVCRDVEETAWACYSGRSQ